MATGTADTFGSGVANWTPDYATIGDLTDGTWTIAAREVVTPGDGSRAQTSRWSDGKRFQVDTEIPESPTVTLNADGSLSLAAKGAAGFVWSFGAIPVLEQARRFVSPAGTRTVERLLPTIVGRLGWSPG